MQPCVRETRYPPYTRRYQTLIAKASAQFSIVPCCGRAAPRVTSLGATPKAILEITTRPRRLHHMSMLRHREVSVKGRVEYRQNLCRRRR